MVVNLRTRSGLEKNINEELMTKLEESIVRTGIPKHEHSFLHSIADTIREKFHITGETPSERLGNIVRGVSTVVHGMAEEQRRRLAKVPPPEVPVRPVPPPPRREVEAECEKVLVGSGEAFDIGDIEGIRIGEDVVITLPTGKKVYLISKGRGVIPTSVKKLEEVV